MPPRNLFEERNWLLVVTSFEATNSVFNITDENKSFSIGTPGYWRNPNFLPDGNIDRLKEILEIRSQIDIELHVEQVEERSTPIEIENSGYKSARFDHFKNEMPAEFHDLKVLVYRMELTYDELMDVLDIKYTSATSIGYTVPPGIYKIIIY